MQTYLSWSYFNDACLAVSLIDGIRSFSLSCRCCIFGAGGIARRERYLHNLKTKTHFKRNQVVLSGLQQSQNLNSYSTKRSSKMKSTLVTLCLLSAAIFGSAFTPPAGPRVRSDLSLNVIVKSSTHPIGDGVGFERRNFLGNGLFAAAAVAATLTSEPTPARADVSDGNELPPGVAQFSRLVRGKVELTVSRTKYASCHVKV
jgi:hypothetical protein